jgi:hypothetical protein
VALWPIPEAGPLQSSWAKFNRAIFHLRALNDELERFNGREADSHRLTTEVDKETSSHYLRIQILRPFPTLWSLIVGDMIHNFRASLDYMMWSLVLANGNRPTRGTQFPIYKAEPPSDPRDRSRRNFERNVKGISPEARELIEKLQPYRGEHGQGPHIFSALNALSNQDKHHFVVPSFGAVAIPKSGKLSLDVDWERCRDIGSIYGTQLHTGKPLQDGDKVTTSRVEITGPDPHVEIKGGLEIDVGFGEPPVPKEAFRQLGEAVETALGTAEIDVLGFDRSQLGSSASTEMG